MCPCVRGDAVMVVIATRSLRLPTAWRPSDECKRLIWRPRQIWAKPIWPSFAAIRTPVEEALKPSEFFIGVVDLFAILLPGAIATWIAIHFSETHRLPVLMSLGLAEASGAVAWLAFFVSAYILGHLAHTVSSYLDRLPWMRQRCREVVARVDPAAAQTDTAVKDALAFLLIVEPHTLTEVRRLEADSKFFRSLVMVIALVFLRLVFGLNNQVHVVGALTCIGLLSLSFVCYSERRRRRWGSRFDWLCSPKVGGRSPATEKSARKTPAPT